MARRDIAGLAALGALGMMLAGKSRAKGDLAPVEDRGTAVQTLADDQYNPDVSAVDRNENYGNEGRRMGPVAIGRVPVRTTPAPVRREDYGNEGRRRGPVAVMEESGRPLTREQAIAAIPTGGRPGAGPTPSEGNSASGSELGRNVRNTLSALAPFGGGAANAVTEAAMAPRATRLFLENLAKARRAAEGYSPEEALAMRQAAELAAREGKVFNPMAWMAGPKGMSKFKKGGSVKPKKMASGGAAKSSASSRGDGIAKRGKTRGKLY